MDSRFRKFVFVVGGDRVRAQCARHGAALAMRVIPVV
jgi:hypothetical protein